MISLIIVDYNSIEKTMNYIKHFLDKVDSIVNIIIVDNASNDKSINYMDTLDITKIKVDVFIKEDKNIDLFFYKYKGCSLVIVKANENLGYGKGNNLGAIISNKIYNNKFYIFSNNDLKFNKNIDLSTFIEIFNKDKDIAVIGPKIIGLEGEPQSPRKYNNIWKQLILYFPNVLLCYKFTKFITNIDYNNKSKYTYWVNGCFLVVDAQKFEEVSMFDENTFLYAEEMILSERLLQKGYKNYFTNDVEIIHEHGQTIKDTFSTLKGMEISFNSNLYYFKKYRKTKKIYLKLSIISFKIFKLLFPFKENIKNVIGRKK